MDLVPIFVLKMRLPCLRWTMWIASKAAQNKLIILVIHFHQTSLGKVKGYLLKVDDGILAMLCRTWDQWS